MSPALDLIGRVVRGGACAWPDGSDDRLEAAVLASAIEHSVEALMYWRLATAGELERWPESVRQGLTRVARAEAALEAVRQPPLRALLSALESAGVRAVVFKGAALAYTHYAHAWLRPRNDADLLVEPAGREAATDVLRGLGYRAGDVLKGDIAGHQAPFTLIDRMGLRHTIDLHWKISNRPLLADMLTFDEMWGDAARAEPLGPAAHVAGDAHALLMACVHPVVHHRNGNNLLWWYDVHVIASHLSAAQFERFADMAVHKGVAAICASSLRHAARNYHTSVPDDVVRRLDSVRGEVSAQYLSTETWRGDVRLADFRSLGSWRSRLKLVKEVGFPDAEYMLKVYGRSSRLWLPALHAHRLVRGTWRLLGRWRRGAQASENRLNGQHERSA